MSTTAPHSDDALIRISAVIALTGLSRTEIYKRVKADTFPKQIPLSTSDRRGAPVAWSRNEVQAWIKLQIDASRAA